jgi:serine O-acetyltransferase
MGRNCLPSSPKRSFRRSLDDEKLSAYVTRQIEALMPDGVPVRAATVVREAAERARFCFAHVRHPAFRDDDAVYFDHLHGDQYTAFLYYASNSAHAGGDETLAKKLFLLNKALNGFFCQYDTLLPPVMWLNHALGTVIGRGTYGNYLLVTQNVTFGKDRDAAPVTGEGVIVYGGALIAGATTIGDRTAIAANAAILNEAVPAESVVAGTSPNLVIRPRKRDLAESFFDIA